MATTEQAQRPASDAIRSYLIPASVGTDPLGLRRTDAARLRIVRRFAASQGVRLGEAVPDRPMKLSDLKRKG
jgi:hypothetical protein